MNKLSKDKRDKLILVSLFIVGILGALYTFVLAAQKDSLEAVRRQIEILSDKVSKAERLVKSEDLVARNLAESQRAIESRMRDMAPHGQYYYWLLKLLDEFRKSEKLSTGFLVDITPQPQFIEVGMLPKFPFKAASFGVRLNGRFQEIGRFLSDLENTFPYFRVQDIRIAPGAQYSSASSKAGGEPSTNEGKLMVEIRLVTLIKPGGTGS